MFLLIPVLSNGNKPDITLSIVERNTSIRGIISNPADKDIGIRFYRDNISFDEELFNIPVGKDNGFSMSFELQEPTTAIFSYYGQEITIYLEPGDDLTLNFDGLNFRGTLRFSGRGAAHNRFLYQSKNVTRQWDTDFILYEIVQRTPLSFRMFMDGVKKRKWEFYRNYSPSERSQFSDRFIKYLAAEINYWWAYNLLRYQTEHSVSNGLQSPINIPPSYYDFLNQIVISNDDALNSRSYLFFLEQYLIFREENPIQIEKTDIALTTILVTAPSMLLLAEPNKPPVMMELKKGTRVKYLDERSDFKSQILIKDALHEDYWYKIRTAEGVEGWIVGVGVEFESYENNEEDSQSVKSFLAGKALAYTQANQIYWKLHLEDPAKMKEEVESYLAHNEFESYDRIIKNAFDISVKKSTVKKEKVLYGATVYRIVEDPKISSNAHDETIVIAGLVDSNSEKTTDNKTDKKSSKNDAPKTELKKKTEITKLEKPIEKEAKSTGTKPTTKPAVTKAAPPKPRIPIKQTRKESYVDLPEVIDNRTSSRTAISGKINTALGRPLTLVVYEESILFERKEFPIQIKGDHSFNHEVGLTNPVLASLAYGNEEIPLYLEPSDQLIADFEGTNYSKSLSFSGKGSHHNSYLLNYYRTYKNINQSVSSKVKSLSAIEFQKFMKEQKNARLKFLDAYKSGGRFSSNFIAFAEAEIIYWYAYQLLNYPWENALANNREEPRPLPEDYYNFLAEVPASNNGALPSMNYTYFLDEFLNYQTNLKFNTGLTKKELADRFLHGDILNYYKAKLYTIACKRGKAGELGQEIRSFIENNQNNSYNKVLRMAYQEAKGLTHGADAPGFELTDVAGKKINLSDFEGKVVYLDFWASWCSPCVLKMRNSRQWKSQFRGKEVAFVYVNLDKNKSAWTRWLSNNAIDGIHIASENGMVFNSEIARKYLVKRLPATFLIDKNGKIAYNSSKDSGTGRVADYINNLLFSQ